MNQCFLGPAPAVCRLHEDQKISDSVGMPVAMGTGTDESVLLKLLLNRQSNLGFCDRPCLGNSDCYTARLASAGCRQKTLSWNRNLRWRAAIINNLFDLLA